MKKPILEFDNVNKTFNGKKIYNNLSFKIDKNEIVGIEGPSGIGKTTILKMINRLIKNDSGNIYFNNINIIDYDLVELRKRIGLVFQNYNLFEHLTVLENLTLPLIKIKKMTREEAIKESNKYLKMIKLEDKKGSYPCELSGGEMQRVAIVRALVTEPTLLLLDEPTSALDKELKKEIIKLIKQINEMNVTIIIVSHEEEFLNKICNRIITFDKNDINIRKANI